MVIFLSSVTALRKPTSKHDCWQQSCLTCPVRSFTTVDQLRRRVQLYHVKETSDICAGHKRKRVAWAIHDADSLAGKRSVSLLRRSAAIIRRHVTPPLDHGRDNINGELRLVLTGRGSIHVDKKAVSTDGDVHVRRVGNLYHTRCFANIVYCELVMHEARLAEGVKHVQLQIAVSGSEPGNLVPENSRYTWKVVHDVFSVSPAQALVTEHLQEFSKEGEFHTLSNDCTLKIALATIGQAPQAFAESEHRRKLLTIRGLTGAEESADEMAQALQKEGDINRSPSKGPVVATDKPSGKMFVVMKQALPNLQCLMRYECRCRSSLASQVHCPNVCFFCDSPFLEFGRVRWNHTRFLCLGLAYRHAFRIRALSG